jgi:hypothetical protein
MTIELFQWCDFYKPFLLSKSGGLVKAKSLLFQTTRTIISDRDLPRIQEAIALLLRFSACFTFQITRP